MAAGICKLIAAKSYYRLNEPMVIGVLQTVVPEFMTLYFGERLRDVGNSSAAIGDLLDFNVAIAICSLRQLNVLEVLFNVNESEFLKRFSRNGKIPEHLKDVLFCAEKVVGTSHREALKSLAEITTINSMNLTEFLSKNDVFLNNNHIQGTSYLLPNPSTDFADGCLFLPPSTLLLTANKFSGDANVESSDVDSNAKSTEKALKKIMDDTKFPHREFTTVIRLHVVFPLGANRVRATGPASHPPGLTISDKELNGHKYTEATVNIDQTNLKHLFPADLAEVWKTRHNVSHV